MLEDAKVNKYAVPHFNINNLEWTRYILEECNRLKSPVILGVSEGAIRYMGGYKVVANLVKNLDEELNIQIPVAIHLDHGSSVESCKKAVDAGFTSVMIDASKYSLEENIDMTKQVVEYARIKNITIEAEIGHIGGSEDNMSSELAYAKVDDAVKLYNETKIDFLAPALGSVHGLYKGEPCLDFDKMKEISEKTNIPLVLHGGSSNKDEEIAKAVKIGISKINISSDIKVAFYEKCREVLNAHPEYREPLEIYPEPIKACREVIAHKVNLFDSADKVKYYYE